MLPRLRPFRWVISVEEIGMGSRPGSGDLVRQTSACAYLAVGGDRSLDVYDGLKFDGQSGALRGRGSKTTFRIGISRSRGDRDLSFLLSFNLGRLRGMTPGSDVRHMWAAPFRRSATSYDEYRRPPSNSRLLS